MYTMLTDLAYKKPVKKKRVMITIHPELYEYAKNLHRNFSALLEQSLRLYLISEANKLDEKEKEEIRLNLRSRALDPECQKEDLQICKDFEFADADMLKHYD